MPSEKLRIIFFGTPEFAATSLRAMAEAGHQVIAVITAPDKPAGRGQKTRISAVKQAALDLGLNLLQPPNLKDPAFVEELRNLKPDLGVVIAFRMLPEIVWSMPVLGTFNLHASLLPDYRGAAPINHAIINGETTTGLTTFFLRHEIDTGDIVLQEKVEILPDENAGELHNKLMMKGAELVLQTLHLIEKGNWQTHPQNDNGNWHQAPKLNREFCRLSQNSAAEQIRNKIRGLSPVPGAWIETEYGVLKIYEARMTAIPADKEVLSIGGKNLYLNASDFKLQLIWIQPEGKPRMQAADFINGLANKG